MLVVRRVYRLVLDLRRRLQLRDERVHRLAPRIVPQQVPDLVVRVHQRAVLLRVRIAARLEEGGDLGFMDVADMAPGMAQVVANMRKGEVSPLLSLGPSSAQVAVLDIEEAKVDTADAEAKPDEATARRIEEILRRPRVQERLQQYTTELRQKALVDIRL